MMGIFGVFTQFSQQPSAYRKLRAELVRALRRFKVGPWQFDGNGCKR